MSLYPTDSITNNHPCSKLYKMLYKTSLDDKFHVLDVLSKKCWAKIYENIHLVPLYTIIKAITEETYKYIKNILLYIPSIYQKYFKSLKTQNPISEG